MWKKFLKYQDLARTFIRVEVGNGHNTYFLFDAWSSMEIIYDLTGSRGYIDMGISEEATVASVMNNHRIRSHRVEVLNAIENEIMKLRQQPHLGEDKTLWKIKETSFSKNFNNNKTWN